jgi:hypothetical protein
MAANELLLLNECRTGDPRMAIHYPPISLRGAELSGSRWKSGEPWICAFEVWY